MKVKFFRTVSLVLSYSLLLATPVYADVATKSEAGYESDKQINSSDKKVAESILEQVKDGGELTSFDFEQLFYDAIYSMFTGPAVATDSEAMYLSSNALVEDSKAVSVESAELLEMDSFELDNSLLASFSRSKLDVPDVNVTWYRVKMNGNEYDLVFPKSDADSLWVSDSGYLYNVGAATVTGRIFDSSSPVVPSDKSYDLVFLAPILRDNMSTLYNYNSYNELREYYWQSGRKYYNSTYVNIEVLGVNNTYQTSSYLTYVIIFILGGVLICLLRKSLR